MARGHFKCHTVTDWSHGGITSETTPYCFPSDGVGQVSECLFFFLLFWKIFVLFFFLSKKKGSGQTRPDTAGHRRAPLTPQKGTE
jgi:hypothetical protein